MTDRSVYSEFSASTPFYGICILFLFLATISSFVLVEYKKDYVAESRSFKQRINIFKRMGALFINKHLKFLMITYISFALAVDIYYEFGPVYLTVKWSLDPSELVYFNGILCLALALGNGWLPAYFDSVKSKKLGIVYSIGVIALSLIGMVLTNSTVVMMLLSGIIGLAIGVAATLITVKISDSVSDNIQGEVMGVQISLRVLGDAMICLLGGLLLLFSPKLILIVAAAISVGAMLFYSKRSL